MKVRKSKILWMFCALLIFCLPIRAGASEQEALLEKSGAPGMYESLEEGTRELLSKAGVDSPKITQSFDVKDFFSALSQLLKDRISAPLKAAAALIASLFLCRLFQCFQSEGSGWISSLAGTASCAGVLLPPLIRLISSCAAVIQNASVFLMASVPVYSALMAAGGNVITGSSYGLLTLAAANLIPAFSAAVIFPMLHIFLALSLTSAVSQQGFDAFLGKLYGIFKWVLILLASLFSGALSIQTVINIQADSAAGKAAKMIISSALPIVGGAFSDSLSAIKSSIEVVRSGVGAFGMLAALCIFLPLILETLLWSGVCAVGEIAAELFEVPKLKKLLGACLSTAKMLLAALISTALVCVVSAAVVLFLRGSL